ncbi:hypothetical protein V8C86DRAFT_2436756 [Haematococcus lacustris]
MLSHLLLPLLHVCLLLLHLDLRRHGATAETLPSPAQPSPAQPSPAQPSPAQPSPAQPSPAQPSPAQPSPAQPSPAQPSPAQPSPAYLGFFAAGTCRPHAVAGSQLCARQAGEASWVGMKRPQGSGGLGPGVGSELSPNDKWNDEKSTADVKSEEALNVAYHGLSKLSADPLLQHNLWVQEHSAPA